MRLNERGLSVCEVVVDRRAVDDGTLQQGQSSDREEEECTRPTKNAHEDVNE